MGLALNPHPASFTHALLDQNPTRGKRKTAHRKSVCGDCLSWKKVPTPQTSLLSKLDRAGRTSGEGRNGRRNRAKRSIRRNRVEKFGVCAAIQKNKHLHHVPRREKSRKTCVIFSRGKQNRRRGVVARTHRI